MTACATRSTRDTSSASASDTELVSDSLDRYLDEHRDRFVAELRELCAIPCETGNAAALDDALRPVHDAIKAAPPQVQPEAEAKLAALKQEAAKGKDANDGVMAKLVDGLMALVPAAAGAVGSAFATPILGALVGPVTSFVIDKLRGK